MNHRYGTADMEPIIFEVNTFYTYLVTLSCTERLKSSSISQSSRNPVKQSFVEEPRDPINQAPDTTVQLTLFSDSIE
jgi:hypothetical protein